MPREGHEAGSMRVKQRCPRCGERNVWEAPTVADETWSQTFAMPAAWRHDGTPMGHLEVSACGACGLVEWHCAAVGELDTDEDAGVALLDEDVRCRACDHDRVWRVERMRDVRSAMGSDNNLAAHTRGLGYRARGKRDKADEPIAIPGGGDRGRPLGGKAQLRNLLSHGALHGRPVGHLEERVCDKCGFTDFYAHDSDEVRGDGKIIDHACSACEHAEALELPTFDLRAEGINAKRVALSRSEWGNTRADMVLRICTACSHTDWFVADTTSLAEAEGGVSRVTRDEGVGVYRRAAREEPAEAPAPNGPSRNFWVAVAGVSGAVALFILVHPAATIAALAPLAAWFWMQRQPQGARIAAPRRVEEPPEAQEEDEAAAEEEKAAEEER